MKTKVAKTKPLAAESDWEKNRLKPGALFYITVEGERYPMRYPKRRGKLPLSTIRKLVDSMVSLRENAVR